MFYPPGTSYTISSRVLFMTSGGSRIFRGSNPETGAPTYCFNNFFPENCMQFNEWKKCAQKFVLNSFCKLYTSYSD